MRFAATTSSTNAGSAVSCAVHALREAPFSAPASRTLPPMRKYRRPNESCARRVDFMIIPLAQCNGDRCSIFHALLREMIRKKFRDLSRRNFWLTVIPVAVVVLTVFVFAFRFIEPAPPDTIVVSTGAVDSGYHMFALRYKEILARDGVKLELRPSAGAQENVSRLLDDKSDVEVGFLQGGSAFTVNAPDLVSLGSIYYEPLWVFYRGTEIHDFVGLRGKKLAIGPEESGTRALPLQLLSVNPTVTPPPPLPPHTPPPPTELLLH